MSLGASALAVRLGPGAFGREEHRSPVPSLRGGKRGLVSSMFAVLKVFHQGCGVMWRHDMGYDGDVMITGAVVV